jgi:hypothetical protein
MDEEATIKEIEEIKLKEEARAKQTCKKQDAYHWFKTGVMAERFSEENLSAKGMLRDFNKKWSNLMGK